MSVARAINTSGVVTGFAMLPSGATHAFIVGAVPATAMIDLGTLGGDNSYAYGINDRGEVVGAAEDAGGVTRAFIWNPEAGEPVDLNELLPRGTGGWQLRHATHVNNMGQIVGAAIHDGNLRAFRLSP